MTKQEQYDEYLKGYYQHKADLIEKMAVIGCVRNPQAHTVEECSKCDFKQGMCNAYRHAEALYNAGYRTEATLTCDFIKMAQKHAVQEFVDELRNKCSEVKGYEYSFANIAHLINQLLKEYEE